MWKRLLFIPPLLLGAAVLALVVANRPAPERQPPAEEAKAVRVLKLEPVKLIPHISGHGTVRPARAWSAIAQVGGKVRWKHPRLKVGEVIAAGEEIIRIDDADYKLAVAQAEAAVRSAEAKLAELDVTEQNTRSLLALEKQALAIAERDYQRKKTLLARGTVPQTVLEQAQRALLSQRKLVATLENTLKLLPAQRQSLKEQLATARNQLETAKLNLARTRISMPFEGRITSVAVEVGQFAPVGKALAAADGIDAAEVETPLPIARLRTLIALVEHDAPPLTFDPQRVHERAKAYGLHVRVVLRDGGRDIVWPGRFDRLSGSIDARTRTIGVVGVVDRPYDNVIPGVRPPLTRGMFVRMDVLAKPLEQALVLPRVALRENDKVFVANGEQRLEIRPVKVKARLGDLVVIEQGLEPGDLVVLSDLAPAIAGQKLLAEEDAKAARQVRALAAGEDAPADKAGSTDDGGEARP